MANINNNYDSNYGGKRKNAGRTSSWNGETKGITPTKTVRVPNKLADAIKIAKGKYSTEKIIEMLRGVGANPHEDYGIEGDLITPIELGELRNQIKRLETENTQLESKCNDILDQTEKMIHAIPEECLIDNTEELQQKIKQLESELEASQIAMKDNQDKLSKFVQANTELGNVNSDLIEDIEDSKTTIEALRADIGRLEQDLNSLQSKQAEQKQQFNEPIEGVATRIDESVIENFHQKALETSATNPRYDQLRELLAALGYDWNKQGKKGWFSTLKRRIGK